MGSVLSPPPDGVITAAELDRAVAALRVAGADDLADQLLEAAMEAIRRGAPRSPPLAGALSIAASELRQHRDRRVAALGWELDRISAAMVAWNERERCGRSARGRR